ncbi:hypothetical protein T4D_9160 [Trichinella pseudospiralis]|uniref:Uncharacterized protein n=1 Tax=Trichinella pseudospiralis TaxID=6337 RepID=A0A0V1E5K8_TRIPS|nr:hypothetical protein T4D_9160 [Trichinella pseudospiralis]
MFLRTSLSYRKQCDALSPLVPAGETSQIQTLRGAADSL